MIFNALLAVLNGGRISTLGALLDCGEKEWADIEEGEKQRLWFFQKARALELKFAVASLQNLAEQNKLQGDLAAAGAVVFTLVRTRKAEVVCVRT